MSAPAVSAAAGRTATGPPATDTVVAAAFVAVVVALAGTDPAHRPHQHHPRGHPRM
ncbi:MULTISPECIES: hypothetical protein [unclassified Streptomyces]|uniref:hypothetical protein n=1 Tax=unclassified Streptomyces TaxID=2593676 RepID=UPI000A61E35A|nr:MULTISPECIES: hypothetical protein [unclassified Streptomyces]